VAHPVCHPKGTEIFARGKAAGLTADLHLASSLRRNKAVPVLPPPPALAYLHSVCCDNFDFYTIEHGGHHVYDVGVTVDYPIIMYGLKSGTQTKKF
jgi:hypothetical protein